MGVTGDGSRLPDAPEAVALGGVGGQHPVHAADDEVVVDAQQPDRLRRELDAEAARLEAALDGVDVRVAARHHDPVLHVEQAVDLDEHRHARQRDLPNVFINNNISNYRN